MLLFSLLNIKLPRSPSKKPKHNLLRRFPRKTFLVIFLWWGEKSFKSKNINENALLEKNPFSWRRQLHVPSIRLRYIYILSLAELLNAFYIWTNLTFRVPLNIQRLVSTNIKCIYKLCIFIYLQTLPPGRVSLQSKDPLRRPVKANHILLSPEKLRKLKSCETGPTVYRLYPGRLGSLTICGCNYKGSTFNWVI